MELKKFEGKRFSEEIWIFTEEEKKGFVNALSRLKPLLRQGIETEDILPVFEAACRREVLYQVYKTFPRENRAKLRKLCCELIGFIESVPRDDLNAEPKKALVIPYHVCMSPLSSSIKNLNGCFDKSVPTMRRIISALDEIDELELGQRPRKRGRKQADDHGFALELAQLYCDIYGKKPSSAADGPFADLVREAYKATFKVDSSTGEPCVDRPVRQAIKNMEPSKILL